ncbi:helix-turn-helix domain-containing protein [Kitasatospora sp. NPDC059146]|uniref:helix-turn-helix domain-containing protein n=1 Tax=unclassified Kitasatospora TaxID=2633591 RepID=UPI0036BFCBEA
MATAPMGPLQHRRKVGRRLKEFREVSGLTVEQAGQSIGVSDSTMSRIENGKRDVKMIELKGLLDRYSVPEDERNALLAMAREAPEGGMWTAHEAAFPPTLETYLGLEEAARTLRVFALGSIHSLTRTRPTMRGILRSGLPAASDTELDLLTDAHMARQEVLTREPVPVELAIILDEAALRRPVGDAEAWRDQLDHLIRCGEEVPNITFQCLPFAAGPHGSLTGGFTMIDFPDPAEPEVVYCDTPGGNLYLPKPKDIRRFGQLYTQLCGQALSPAASLEFVRTIRHET